jgi:predicted DNA-binding transcriptional regulator YafY
VRFIRVGRRVVCSARLGWVGSVGARQRDLILLRRSVPDRYSTNDAARRAHRDVLGATIEGRVISREHTRVSSGERRSQKLDELPDGGVRLSFPSQNLSPIVSWVLEWGPQARFIDPPELVAKVVAELDAARKLYDPG